jgi:ComF family protein
MLLDYLFVEHCRLCKALIAPQSCEARTVCAQCWEPLREQAAQLDECTITGLGTLNVAHAVSYEERIKMLIYKLKYDHDRLIASDLSLLLHKALNVISAHISDPGVQVLVPVPLSRWRKLQRGFNQAELLAMQLQKLSKVKYSTRLLFRRRHTQAQHKLSREERATNLLNAFQCAGERAIPQQSQIIILDDIHTSGATLAEAARALKLCGAQNVAAITVARALLTGTR